MEADRFKQQFFSFHPKLYRIAMAMVGNKNDAEDILQDAYYKLWNKRMELQDIQNPEAFSVTLIKNMCLDFLRSPRANRHEKELETVHISYESSPDVDLERAEDVRIVKQLIEKLPEKQKLVIKLCGLEECSLAEVEEITNFSGTNVRTLLFRARKTIKEQYLKIKGT
ncbi:RNA polymerase sigma factor [Bacteroides sp. UBA939]|uniref:RNA polymerase sigma factor n=1 Tax=Bacteroides sp. UBA939 TaxID=1946092 RepID=UPI0025BA2B88|nr:sigma-70 family RNA polymerase sigma factor [Bacteroides sp. UBA939]